VKYEIGTSPYMRFCKYKYCRNSPNLNGYCDEHKYEWLVDIKGSKRLNDD